MIIFCPYWTSLIDLTLSEVRELFFVFPFSIVWPFGALYTSCIPFHAFLFDTFNIFFLCLWKKIISFSLSLTEKRTSKLKSRRRIESTFLTWKDKEKPKLGIEKLNSWQWSHSCWYIWIGHLRLFFVSF